MLTSEALLTNVFAAGAKLQEPEIDNLPKEKDHSKLINTTESIVDFILKGVETVGSGLPGIGAVSVVLAAKDKFKVFYSHHRCICLSHREWLDRRRK